MANMNKVGKVATQIIEGKAGWKIVRYHNTDVVTFDRTTIILNHGGYMTATTKTRMNQASREFNLGFSVSQKNRTWFIEYKGTTYEFSGSRHTLSREGSTLEKAG